MQNSFLDDFLTNISGFNCFIINSKKKIKNFINIKSKYLLVFKSNERLNSSDISGFEVKVQSKLIQYKKKIKLEKKIKFKCRSAKVGDIGRLLKICRENLFGSRFEMDNNLGKKFLKKYRSVWIKNFFLKKRGDYLIVSYDKEKILGFILLIKEKKFLKIDQILVANKHKKSGVAKSLINYVNNLFFGRFNYMTAGTYDHNFVAKKMYKSLGFVKQNKKTYIYHLYPKNKKTNNLNEQI